MRAPRCRRIPIGVVAAAALAVVAGSVVGISQIDTTPTTVTEPPARVCGNFAILDGPATAPDGAVVVPAGDNAEFFQGESYRDPAAPGKTYWFAPGTHTIGVSEFGQIVPKDGDSYIGAPGAILDGQSSNRYAFTGKATNVTVKHLTVTGFMAPGDEGVVNHDFGPGWTIERNTVSRNNGAGVMLGDDNRMTYNCLADNGQYGFQGFGKFLTIDRNEVARNNVTDWETNQPGCGCSGGSKFWSSGPGTVTNNWVHDNMNVGLWWDNNNREFLVEGNLIEGNRGHGIEYETSYNVVIRNNTLRRNAIPSGHVFQARNDPFPVGAIYLSEAGGDARLGAYPTVEVSNNRFEENWAGIVGWENADRFGHDDTANTSKGYTTLTVDPSGAWPSPEMPKCGDPANGGLVDTEPYTTDCRWRTVNLNITGNTFVAADKAAIGCTTDLCNQHGLFSNYGTVPSWSPYLGRTVQENITFRQNNVWSNNTYSGDWRFVAYEAVGPTLSFDQWRAAPYSQDAGSTYSGDTTTTTTSTTTAPSTTTTTTTTAGSVVCGRETIWPDSQTATEYGGVAGTFGTRFTVSATGAVSSLRFYETETNDGPVSLKLWQLTSATTANELAAVSFDASGPGSGWRNVELASPVVVSAANQYMVSYHINSGNFIAAVGYFASARVSGTLTAPANNDPVGYGNGTYQSEIGHTFPAAGQEHSYFADVVFTKI
ncbi:MAG: DUF4082 domain-containing protein [Chloroflexi bacterium]|nr:DUF4082 domain-containing protein [Chloroflexota bacterium]